MNPTQLILQHLPELQLKRLGDETEAGLLLTSLPWPRASRQDLSLGHLPTYTKPLGQWPGEAPGTPRRLLMAADCAGNAPAELTVSDAAASTNALPPVRAEMELFERSPSPHYIWERHFLRLSKGERSIGLAMGLRTGETVHWWEACRLVVLEKTEQCLTVEMGGAIPHKHMTYEEFKQYEGLKNPYLHKHNWINGHILARLHANGVCEIYAHHINSRFFDEGADLEDSVPVIGFVSNAGDEALDGLCGTWDGSVESLEIGSGRLDVREAARLATPEKPGSLERDGQFLVWQPYQGMELFGGTCPRQLIGDSYIYRAERHVVPRGMARTLRFSLSLSDRSPRIARYLAPAWWYGLCEELVPDSLLPVFNRYDETSDAASQWVLDNIIQRGFEDGSVPRHTNDVARGEERNEPGWEGEIPYGQFLRAWRSGDAREYDAAMRSAYHFADVAVDHASKLVRMHGYPPIAYAIPMNRTQGPLAAYLETGDTYLLDIAKAVTSNSHYMHKNSWPRLAVGRDASYIRSAVLLYRYFGIEHFREIAHEAALTVAEVQRPDGAFGDQGGGTGIHQWSGYVIKPWMAMLGLNGVVDYLEVCGDEPRLLECVRRCADWLMAERFDHDGIMGWSYQHMFDTGRSFYSPFEDKAYELPNKAQWHQENLGRFLAFCALKFDQPAYLDAWAQSHEGKVRPETGDHAVSAALQFIPWVQAKLWQAHLTEAGVKCNPVDFGPLTPKEARVLAPDGEMPVVWPK